MIGEGARRLIQKALEKCRLSLPVEFLVNQYTERYASHLTDCTTLYPDVGETLAGLQDYRMALVSNKTELLSRRILDVFGLSRYFEAVVCADTIPQRKPSPEPLLHVLSALQVPVTHAVMVGDSEIDIVAGKACSMRTIAITHGYGKPGFQAEADFAIYGLLPLAGSSKPSLKYVSFFVSGSPTSLPKLRVRPIPFSCGRYDSLYGARPTPAQRRQESGTLLWVSL